MHRGRATGGHSSYPFPGGCHRRLPARPSVPPRRQCPLRDPAWPRQGDRQLQDRTARRYSIQPSGASQASKKLFALSKADMLSPVVIFVGIATLSLVYTALCVAFLFEATLKCKTPVPDFGTGAAGSDQAILAGVIRRFVRCSASDEATSNQVPGNLPCGDT